MSLKWGIISAGQAAHDFVAAISESTNHEIVAVAARNVETAKKLSEKFSISVVHASYEELVSDPKIRESFKSVACRLHLYERGTKVKKDISERGNNYFVFVKMLNTRHKKISTLAIKNVFYSFVPAKLKNWGASFFLLLLLQKKEQQSTSYREKIENYSHATV